MSVDSGGGTDGALWARALEGEGAGEAVGVIFDRHERRLFRAALRQAESVHDAEDVVSTVFLELWRLRARVRVVEGSLLPWLLVTLGNVQRNAVRSRLRHRALLAKMPTDPPAPDAAELALDSMESLQRDRRIGAALQELRPGDRQILFLTAVEGLSVAECAAALGIRTDAAKARLTRARQRARTLLADEVALLRTGETQNEEALA